MKQDLIRIFNGDIMCRDKFNYYFKKGNNKVNDETIAALVTLQLISKLIVNLYCLDKKFRLDNTNANYDIIEQSLIKYINYPYFKTPNCVIKFKEEFYEIKKNRVRKNKLIELKKAYGKY